MNVYNKIFNPLCLSVGVGDCCQTFKGHFQDHLNHLKTIYQVHVKKCPNNTLHRPTQNTLPYKTMNE